MGGGFSAEQRQQAVCRQLESQYIIEEHPAYRESDSIKLLFDRSNGKNYALRILSVNQ
jgi:hypothetical protein